MVLFPNSLKRSTMLSKFQKPVTNGVTTENTLMTLLSKVKLVLLLVLLRNSSKELCIMKANSSNIKSLSWKWNFLTNKLSSILQSKKLKIEKSWVLETLFNNGLLIILLLLVWLLSKVIESIFNLVIILPKLEILSKLEASCLRLLKILIVLKTTVLATSNNTTNSVNYGLKNQKKHSKLSLKQKMLKLMPKIKLKWKTKWVMVALILTLNKMVIWLDSKINPNYLKELELESLLLKSSMIKLLILKLKEKKLMKCKMSKTLDGSKSLFNL